MILPGIYIRVEITRSKSMHIVRVLYMLLSKPADCPSSSLSSRTQRALPSLIASAGFYCFPILFHLACEVHVMGLPLFTYVLKSFSKYAIPLYLLFRFSLLKEGYPFLSCSTAAIDLKPAHPGELSINYFPWQLLFSFWLPGTVWNRHYCIDFLF